MIKNNIKATGYNGREQGTGLISFNSAPDGGWILVFNVAITAKNVGRVKGMVIYILYRVINYLYYNILYTF